MKKAEKNSHGAHVDDERHYVTQFLVGALRDKIPMPAHLEIERLVRLRLFYMTLPTVADLMRIPERTLRRRIMKDRNLRASGIPDIGKGGATVYPFWVLHELLALSGGLDDLSDDDGDDTDDDVLRS